MVLRKQQSGAVLFIGVLIILVLSILVATAAQSSVLQQKMTSNLRDKQLAFQSAETALRAAESYIEDTSKEDLTGIFDNTNGLYAFDGTRNLKDTSTWSSLDTVESHSLHQIKQKPVYIIEELPEIKDDGDSLIVPKPISSSYYRATSKSNGGTEASISILQSVYVKNF